jgi:hypothetical protein
MTSDNNLPLEMTLQAHAQICDEMHQVILEENRFLKTAGRPPEESFLVRKRNALMTLSGSVAMLQGIGAQARSTVPAVKALIEKVQQTIMRALLVDRENEQLLLKCSMRPHMAQPVMVRPSATHLQRAYGAR